MYDPSPKRPGGEDFPPHIEETLSAIAKLQAAHDREGGAMQLVVKKITDFIGRPRFVVIVALSTAIWVLGNGVAPWLGKKAWDPPPFASLETIISLLALYVTVLILATQRHDDKIATYREQLTLELAILGEQKSAKIIELLEEIRREHPQLKNRVDNIAEELAVSADPEAILNAIKGSADGVAPKG